MSSSFPNDKNPQVSDINSTGLVTDFVNPEYLYWEDSWRIIRDCLLGETEIKAQSTRYLPKLEGQEDDEYASYLMRGTFYNMCSRTVSGLLGTIFRREPKIENVPDKLTGPLKKITKDNMSLTSFSKQVAQEILAMGRYGALVDMDEDGKKPPYFAGYVAENILDWKVEDVDGRFVLTKVILREIKDNRPEVGSAMTASNNYEAGYRVLLLVKGQYEQHIYEPKAGSADLTGEPDDVIIPENRGKPFDFIPFMFFGPWTNSPGVEKSPLIDIALLNLSHYRSYAQLEHGRFYTALPVFYAPVTGDEGGDYYVGPNRVWEVDVGEKPGIIEYHGHGLVFLEKALDQKEQQVSNIGGRMLGVRGTAVAESDNLVKLKEKNEQSLLLNVTTVINDGLSQMLKWWAAWQDVKDSDMQVKMNQDFLFDTLRAREFRAITMMYQAGILPIDVIFDVMKKAEIIPDHMEMVEFKRALDNPDQFPHQADVLAQMSGFPDAKSQLDVEEAARLRAFQKQNAPKPEEGEVEDDQS